MDRTVPETRREIVAEKSSIHAPVEWAKRRLDEMDAAVAAMEAQMNEVQDRSRQQAADAFGEAQKWRDVFAARMKELQAQSEAARSEALASLDDAWAQFQAGADEWAAATKTHHETFQARASAQIDAWQDIVERYAKQAKDVAAAHQDQVNATLKDLREQANDARAKFDALSRASASSWPAFRQALDESRRAFEQAVATARREFKKDGDDENS
jgi:chromosome segregation ATPase